MDSGARADFEAIKKKLIDAFSLNAFHAYEQLTRRVWRDEPVGVYVSDLRRLAKLAGVETDDLIRRAFVVGLPSEVYRELRAYENIDVLPVSDIVSRARALLAKQVDEDFVAVSKRMTGGGDKKNNETKVRRCFRCGGPHLLRDCTSSRMRRISCWTCGEEGHVMRNCDRQGNGDGKAGAPEVFPQKH